MTERIKDGKCDMELRIMRYFLTVAREGNITRAAEMLHITQPTLSRQLTQLEDELGVQLLERGKRQVVLTEDGVLFEQRASEVIALVEKMEQEFAEQRNAIAGMIYIGSAETTSAMILPTLLKRFSLRYPLVQYDLYSGYADDVKEKMDKGLIDVAILIEPVETSKYNFIRLPETERWGALVPEGDPIGEKSTVMLEQLLEKPLILPRRSGIQGEIADWFDGDYKKIHIYATYNLLSNAALLVQQGMGYALCIQGAAKKAEGVRFVPLEPEKESRCVLVWRKRQIFSAATSLFLQFVKMNMAQEI